VLVAGLQAVDDAQDLGGVAAGRGRVGEDGADGLLGVDDEDAADGEGDALAVDVGGVLVVDPVRVIVISLWRLELLFRASLLLARMVSYDDRAVSSSCRNFYSRAA
jgi:hypothetical protein